MDILDRKGQIRLFYLSRFSSFSVIQTPKDSMWLPVFSSLLWPAAATAATAVCVVEDYGQANKMRAIINNPTHPLHDEMWQLIQPLTHLTEEDEALCVHWSQTPVKTSMISSVTPNTQTYPSIHTETHTNSQRFIHTKYTHKAPALTTLKAC